jgi:hypothetical protein
MNAGSARQIARQWVDSSLKEIPGVEGAFLSGSVCTMRDDAVLPQSSDGALGVSQQLLTFISSLSSDNGKNSGNFQ